MEDEVKVIELELEGMPLKPSDLRMGGVIETKDGSSYIVIMIGARFEFNDEGEPVLLPEQHNAVVGEDLGDAPDDDPRYGTFYNLKLALMDEEDMNNGPVIFSEKKEDYSANHSELPVGTPGTEAQPRTELQHLLFGIHAHYDPDNHEGPGHIIYFETDLAKVCDMMHKSLEGDKSDTTSPETLAFINGQMDIIKQMKDFFDHKA
jgi:hypothetical protein